MVISWLLDEHPHPVTERYRQLIGSSPILLSFQTVAELRFGALRAGWGELRRRRPDRSLAELTVVQPDDQMITTWAQLRTACRRGGHALGDKRGPVERLSTRRDHGARGLRQVNLLGRVGPCGGPTRCVGVAQPLRRRSRDVAHRAGVRMLPGRLGERGSELPWCFRMLPRPHTPRFLGSSALVTRPSVSEVVGQPVGQPAGSLDRAGYNPRKHWWS